jgi:hypothetical protein
VLAISVTLQYSHDNSHRGGHIGIAAEIAPDESPEQHLKRKEVSSEEPEKIPRRYATAFDGGK